MRLTRRNKLASRVPRWEKTWDRSDFLDRHPASSYGPSHRRFLFQYSCVSPQATSAVPLRAPLGSTDPLARTRTIWVLLRQRGSASGQTAFVSTTMTLPVLPTYRPYKLMGTTAADERRPKLFAQSYHPLDRADNHPLFYAH